MMESWDLMKASWLENSLVNEEYNWYDHKIVCVMIRIRLG